MNHSEKGFLMWSAFSGEEGAPMQAGTFNAIKRLLEKGYIKETREGIERYVLTEKGNNEINKLLREN